MTLRIRLPKGTLKVKTRHDLRRVERERGVPVVHFAGLYFIWWRDGGGSAHH